MARLTQEVTDFILDYTIDIYRGDNAAIYVNVIN
jgi:hypothetical protein